MYTVIVCRGCLPFHRALGSQVSQHVSTQSGGLLWSTKHHSFPHRIAPSCLATYVQFHGWDRYREDLLGSGGFFHWLPGLTTVKWGWSGDRCELKHWHLDRFHLQLIISPPRTWWLQGMTEKDQYGIWQCAGLVYCRHVPNSSVYSDVIHQRCVGTCTFLSLSWRKTEIIHTTRAWPRC